MNTIIDAFTAFFASPLGKACEAVILLLVAFIVAYIAKKLILKLLSKTKLAKTNAALSENGPKESAAMLIAKLVQLVVFLLFIPGIFEVLGMDKVSAPILTMLTTIWGYVPNVIGCIVILWVGFYAARLVRELLVPVLNKLEVNKIQKMAGIKVTEDGQLSNTIAYIIYVLILIPVIIAALYVLNIRVITDPAVAMLGVIFQYIPNILAALIIISIGWILAKFIGSIVTRLIEASGLDAKIAGLMGDKNSKFVLSTVVGKTVEVVLIVFFVVESLSTLKLGVLTNIGVAVIKYIPYALTAFIIALVALFLAGAASSALKKNGHPAAAAACRYLIYIVAVFMILNQLGIAPVLVDSAFVIAIAALGVAFALAYGVGGRSFAKMTLALLAKKTGLEKAADEADVKESEPKTTER